MGEHTAYDPALRQAQFEALTNGRGVVLARELIRMKIDACKETLATFPRTPSRQTTVRKLDQALDELDWPPETTEGIRMIEARAALAYFTHWQELHLHWKGVGRKPIPAE
jgi:CRISPR/Cas system-associated endonuclease Cas1